MNMRSSRSEHGFTIIELLIVIVLLLILGSIVALTYSGVQAKNRNGERQTTINAIQGQMEAYYAQYNKYPTLANLNDPNWRNKNTKNLDANVLQDPRWNDMIKQCTNTTASRAIAANQPADNCYSYQVTAADAGACDNVKVDCAHYTLTAKLEGGQKYVKSSLN
jgi:prepilin-type N-terminal cleavage/methylation domain-containing protein